MRSEKPNRVDLTLADENPVNTETFSLLRHLRGLEAKHHDQVRRQQRQRKWRKQQQKNFKN